MSFLHMYGSLLQKKFTYSESQRQLTREIFSRLCTAQGEPKYLTSPADGKKHPYFDQQDYSIARANSPELFEWLDQPEKYVEQFLSSTAQPDAVIKAEDFKLYHAEV